MLEFLKRQRTIVQRRRQAKSILDQRFFARAVARIHAAQLRNRLVRFVDEHQKVARKIIQQRRRRLARQPSRKMPRIIFDAVAVAHRLDHFQIEHRPLMNALRLDQAALLFQLRFPPRQFFLDRLHRRRSRLFLHHIVRLGINRQPHVLLLHRAKQRIDLRQRLDLIAPQLDAVRHVVVGREDLDHVAAHAKRSAPEVAVRALVQNVDQLARDVLALDLLALFQKQHHAVIRFRRSQAVDAAHRSHNQRIAPLKQTIASPTAAACRAHR